MGFIKVQSVQIAFYTIRSGYLRLHSTEHIGYTYNAG